MGKTKSCPHCNEEHAVMFRVQYKPDKTWCFLCEACVLVVKPGNKHYRYGGTWKG
jgi:transcription elongation factor Elf1